MANWGSFTVGDKTYDLSHMNHHNIQSQREASEDFPQKNVNFFISYGHHCFTHHQGDDDHLFTHPNVKERKSRYFCPNRYNLSKKLPEIICSLLRKNPHVKRTYNEFREQFFHLETNINDIDYRIFFEIKKSNINDNEIRIDIRSAYPEDSYATQPSYTGTYKLWMVIDYKLEGKEIPKKKK